MSQNPSTADIRLFAAKPTATSIDHPKGLHLATFHSCRWDQVATAVTTGVTSEKGTFNGSRVPPDDEGPPQRHMLTDASFQTAATGSIGTAASIFSNQSILDWMHRNRRSSNIAREKYDGFESDLPAPGATRHVPPISTNTGSKCPVSCVNFCRHQFAHRDIGENERQMLHQG